MKKTNAWRLPAIHSQRMAPVPSTSPSSGSNPLNDLIARSLASSGVHKLKQGHEVEQVIASALASAGLTSDKPLGSLSSFAGLQKMHSHGMLGGQALPLARQCANEPFEAGQFLDGSFSNAAGARAYKLYVPTIRGRSDAPLPLVVMLHGCTQSPNDFAAGTQMNSLAERDGFLVLYPAQSANANGSNCWNWFRAEDQQRERGEPFLLAGLTRQIVSSYGVDSERVYVAGLSAGAAMAVILGATYPDVFAAVGAHSGLAFGAAHDIPSAFGAMKGSGVMGKVVDPLSMGSGKSATRQTRAVRPMPTIVFHGDRDSTVDAGNGATIVSHAVNAYTGEKALRAPEQTRVTTGNRHCTRIIHTDAVNRPVVEHWILHGSGHAWSGGSARGSYTDVGGPSASDEMVNFFQLHPLANNA